MKLRLNSLFDRLKHLPGHWGKRFLSIVLSIALLYAALPALRFTVSGADYPVPDKLFPIDATNSNSDYTAWYNGFDIKGNPADPLSRYTAAGYGTTLSAVQAVLGTDKTHPYLIETGLELAYLATLVNGGTDFTNKYIKLTGSKGEYSPPENNAIDLIGASGALYRSSDTAISWVACNPSSSSYYWTPIGTKDHPFTGHITSADGVQVYNLNANLLSYKSAYGLFGYVGSGAVIDGIRLVDTQIYVSSGSALPCVGALIGNCESGATVTNCSTVGLDTRLRNADGTLAARTYVSATDNQTKSFIAPDFTVLAENTDACVGGLIGQITDKINDTANTAADTTTVSGVSSELKISVPAGCGIGGVIGRIRCAGASSDAKKTISIDGVSGTVTLRTITDSKGSMYHTGGVVGEISSSANTDVIIRNIATAEKSFTVSLAGNALTANGNDAGNGGFGGVCGYIDTLGSISVGKSGDTAAPCFVSVTATLNKSDAKNNNFYFGGIIGRIRSGVSHLAVSNCAVRDTVFKRIDGGSDSTRISVGGVIGGINNSTGAESYISDCTVDGLRLSCDGLCGGIIGLGTSGSGCNIKTISGCTVTNSEFTIASDAASNASTLYAIVGGITAATVQFTENSSTSKTTTTISGCSVTDTVFNYIHHSTSDNNAAAYNMIGGIVGKCDSGTIENCTSAVTVNIGTDSQTGFFAGGIAAYTANATLNRNIAVLNCNSVASLTNTIELKAFSLDTDRIKNVICGGIVGYTDGTDSISITNSFSSGNIDVSYPGYSIDGTRQSSAGGLIGAANNTGTLTVTGCFSTASIDSNLQDAAGGLIGLDNAANATISNCYFGGCMLEPYGASIVAQQSTSSNYSNLSYNTKYSPAAASQDGGVTATTVSDVPSAVKTALDTLVGSLYYAAATASPVSFDGSHVFAVNSLITADDSHTVITNTENYQLVSCVTTSGTASVTRRVRLIKNIIDTNEDGLNSAFSIGSADELAAMQSYVAAGGGFLGCNFKLAADISSAITAPIGMADDTLKTAAQEDQPFCGRLDGGGHTVTLSGTRTGKTYNGLFGYIQNAAIQNLNIVYDGAVSVPATRYAGGAVGYAAYSAIDGVSVKAIGGLSLSGQSSGGVVGCAKSTVINSDSTSVSSFTGKLTAGSRVGGIMGEMSNEKPVYVLNNAGGSNFAPLTGQILISFGNIHNSSLTRCYATGDVIGGTNATGTNPDNTASRIGGLVGYACGGNTQITDSFAFGNVTGGSYVGGLVGQAGSVGVPLITNSYYNGDIYANSFAGGIVGAVQNAVLTNNLFENGYFVGQIDCDGAKGALTASSAAYKNFYYDQQVAGNIAVTGNTEYDAMAEVNGETLVSGIKNNSSAADIADYGASAIASAITTSITAAKEYTYSNSTSLTDDDLKVVFSGTWTYNSGTASAINDSNGGNRFSAKNGAATNQVSVTFTGTYLTIWDYVSGGHDAYNILIDGQTVDFSNTGGSPYGTSSLYEYTQSYTKNNENATVTYLSQSDHKTFDYLCYVSTDVGVGNTDSNPPVSSFSVSGLSAKEHTVTIIGVKTKSNSYMNIRGFEYGSSGSVQTVSLNGFTFDTQNKAYYPRLNVFTQNALYTGISQLSTEYLYNFTDVAANTANSFRGMNNTITVNAATSGNGTTYTVTDAAALPALGITQSGNVFTANSTAKQGSYYYTTTRDVNGYALSVREKIIVVPFVLGDGTYDVPYQIRNVKELVQFRDFINNTSGGAGLYFKLTMALANGETPATPAHSADGDTYDLTGADQLDTVDGNSYDWADNTAAVWNTPIGTETQPFQGNFDGNGKTIFALKITALYSGGNENSSYNGLFGYISGGLVQNLSVSGSTAADDIKFNTAADKDSYYGTIAAVLDNGTVKNCAISLSALTAVNKTGNSYSSCIGGAIGFARGNATVSSILTDNQLTVSSSAARTNNALVIGNILGTIDSYYDHATVTVNGCISRGTVKYNSYARAAQGGIAGLLSSSGSNGSLTISENAFFGSIDSAAGYLGGIIGSATVNNGADLTLNNNLSTAYLNLGNAANNVADTAMSLGGIAGNISTDATKTVLKSNRFAGELNVAYSKTATAGGIIGSCNNSFAADKNDTTLNTANYYDSTRNPDISAIGNNSTFASADNGAKTTAQLLDMNTVKGCYTAPVPADAVTEKMFGSDVADKVAKQIIYGNTVSLNVVRTDKVYNTIETDSYPHYSSVFVSGFAAETSPAKASTVLIEDYSTASEYYKLTKDAKRAVSTKTATTAENSATVQLANSDTTYGYSDYGKTITYLPSIESIGKSDVSYLCANLAGDGITDGSSLSFTIYTADQLMGLDALVRGSESDGFGNRLYSGKISFGYQIYLARDLDYSALDYVPEEEVTTGDVTTEKQLTNTLIIGDSDNPFTGTLDGQEHTISGIRVNSSSTVALNAGLFATLDGATIKNIGISDSVFTLAADGNVGSFSGTATGTAFNNCYSSARVEHSVTSPASVNVGGFTGVMNGTTAFTDSFFTGSVGVAATVTNGLAAYPAISESGTCYSGGFAGINNGTVTFNGCYAASYIHGNVTATGLHNIGMYIAKGTGADGASVTFGSSADKKCYIDYNTASDGCDPIGDNPSVTAENVPQVTLVQTEIDGSAVDLYPAKWGKSNASELTARIPVSFYTATNTKTTAYSMDTAVTKLGVFTLPADDAAYADNAAIVWRNSALQLYSVDANQKTVRRENSGIVSVVLNYTAADGTTSQRMLVFNPQCWYDNFKTDDSGNKIYTVKNASDLTELANLVAAAADDKDTAGHTHTSAHTGAGIAADAFKTATIRLDNDLVVTDEIIAAIGTSEHPFAGTFDGNGYTIYNASYTTENGVAGLFGHLADTAVIKNVTLGGTSSVTVTEGSADGDAYIGGIAAIYDKGTIENCANGAAITVTNTAAATVWCGGITGSVGAGKELRGCYNMGHITTLTDGSEASGMYLAGIVAKSAGTVCQCYNTGLIEGYTNSLLADYVQRTVVAGICSANSGTVTECYNAGVLRFAAENGLFPVADGTVKTCYADGQYLTPQYSFVNGSLYSEGTTLLLTDKMSGDALFGSGWDAGYWVCTDGYYPQFSYITGDTDTDGAAGRIRASAVSALAGQLSVQTGESSSSFDSFSAIQFRYGKNQNLAITERTGNVGQFEISDITLLGTKTGKKFTVTKNGLAIMYVTAPSADENATAIPLRELYYINEDKYTVSYLFDFGTLTANEQEATLISGTEYVNVDGSPLNTFADGIGTDGTATTRETYGAGTAGSPYLINTAADLTAFAAYINGSNNGGEGRYFTLANDIDCSANTSYTPIGSADIPFAGSFNGMGHTISGLTCNPAQSMNYSGLFGVIGENGTVQLTALGNDCTFYAKTGSSTFTYTGSIAAKCDGVIADCYTRAVVNIPKSTSGKMYVGGLVGELGSGGIIRGCYVRPSNQDLVNAGYNTIVTDTTSEDFICGILIGKTAGTISGCYHTAVLTLPVGEGHAGVKPYAAIAGEVTDDKIKNTYFNGDLIVASTDMLFKSYENSGVILITADSKYAKTTAELKKTEKSSVNGGVANDGMAITLSRNIYLGTYEMSALPFWGQQDSSHYVNDGYPMLTAFDLLQYNFKSFDSSNFILCMQNVKDAQSTEKKAIQLMNALCSYENYDFPVYEKITAKDYLNVNVFSLPDNISFNVSVVGYGKDESGQIKWTVLHGDYTEKHGLAEDYTGEDGTVNSGKGASYVKNDHDGTVNITFNKQDCMPTGCDTLYVYITLKPNIQTGNIWGVYHDWDSSSLQVLPPETEADNAN